MTGQILAVVWEMAAVAFLVLVVLTIRKARARGKRKFRDEPLARIRALRPTVVADHTKDIL